MSDTFTEADLAPDPEEQSAARRAIAERAAATVAVLATGIYLGGLVALGACAAPMVFRITPAPFSGDAMGLAFARFDQIAIGASVLALGSEVVRTWAAGPRGRTLGPRLRRLCAIAMAAATAYVGLSLTPRINELHHQGVRRGEGPQGQLLDVTHRQAELVGKVGMVFGLGLVVLHVFTLRVRRPEDEDDEDAPAPLPPGPRQS